MLMCKLLRLLRLQQLLGPLLRLQLLLLFLLLLLRLLLRQVRLLLPLRVDFTGVRKRGVSSQGEAHGGYGAMGGPRHRAGKQVILLPSALRRVERFSLMTTFNKCFSDPTHPFTKCAKCSVRV